MAKLQSLNGTSGKETIYVDVDDEITAIIDKVQNAKSKVVALVLPKRATVLQSIVNMKLLKRTADNAEKNLVLITSETGLLPLAGAVGLHVASSPTSKPSIPSAPAGPDDETEDADEPLDIVDGSATDTSDDFDRKASANKSIGELATNGASAAAAGTAENGNIDDSIDMAEDDGGESESNEDESAASVPKPKKNSKLHIPNFDSFRKRIVIGVLVVVLLVVGWIYAFTIAPKATITIKTDSSTIATNVNLVLDTSAKALDVPNSVVPATAGTQQKTASQQVAATGQQNNGTKATGTVTVVNCTSDNSEVALPAGRSLSAGGHTYTLNNSVDLPLSGHQSNGNCKSINGASAASVAITALKGGADYNVASGTTFTASVNSSDGFSASDVHITGSTSGGTDDITKIVLQSDIDGATSKIASTDSDAIKQQLISNLQSKGLLAVPSTFLAGTPSVTSSAKAGDAADNVTVTAVTAYTMLGVQKSDIRQLVVANVNSQIDKSKQVILDDGVANATFTQANPGTPTGANVSMTAKSEAGPQLNVKQLKTQLAGRKSENVKNFIKQTPGVTDVNVHFSPFWVSAVPKNANKVTITIDKSGS